MPISLVTYASGKASVPASPGLLSANGQALSWAPVPGAFWYRIYRSDRAGFEAGPDTLLTYVASETTSFRDNGLDFAGRTLTGTWYYRVSAVDKKDRESTPTKAAAVTH
jgi:hypothetical protein